MAISIDVGTIDDAVTVGQGIPEFEHKLTKSQIEERIAGRPHLILIANDAHEHAIRPVAYKVGYEQEDGVFYSWIGGVLPRFRRLHLAQQLLESQEAWVKAQGYREIQVKSMNQFSGMLIMLIKNKYQIIGLEPSASAEHVKPELSKILFRKRV